MGQIPYLVLIVSCAALVASKLEAGLQDDNDGDLTLDEGVNIEKWTFKNINFINSEIIFNFMMTSIFSQNYTDKEFNFTF